MGAENPVQIVNHADGFVGTGVGLTDIVEQDGGAEIAAERLFKISDSGNDFAASVDESDRHVCIKSGIFKDSGAAIDIQQCSDHPQEFAVGGFDTETQEKKTAVFC